MDAFRIQQMVSEHYWHDVVSALEKLFDEVSHEHETIHIDIVEIEMGTVTEKEISRQPWSEVLLSAITEQLREKLTTDTFHSKPTLQVQFRSASICQQWLFYIQHGYLPWNTLQIDEAWKHQALQAFTEDAAAVAALRELLQTHPDAAMRIIQQHSEAFVVQLIAIFTSTNQQSLPSLLHELERVFHALRQSRSRLAELPMTSLRNTLWAHLLKFSALLHRKSDTSVLVQSLLETYLGHPAVLPAFVKETPSRVPMLLPMLKAWEKKALSSDKKKKSAADRKKSTTYKTKENLTPADQERAIPPKEAALPVKDEPLSALERALSDQEEAPAFSIQHEEIFIDEEDIFVQNAGVVLLHPFLSTLFSRLQLMQAGRFVHIKAQQKALYLLHYLATGETTAEEYALVIPKVLCAYPLQKPVSKHVLCTEEETAEADHLLQEAIRQWEMLKHTSPAGLREGFLQRSGKLFSKYDNLYLQVEASAIDVLLDYLPWNLSIIKLPWMQQMIRVEWR